MATLGLGAAVSSPDCSEDKNDIFMIKIFVALVILQALCGCTSNSNFGDAGGYFERVSGPSLSLKNGAKFFEMVFRDVNAHRVVRLIVEYEEFPDEPLTNYDLMRGIQVYEDGNVMSYRSTFDPWGRREQTDGGLLGDLIPEQTRLKSKTTGNYEFIFTESGIGTTPDQDYSVRFEKGKFAGFERMD
jgi:hypothetical protein